MFQLPELYSKHLTKQFNYPQYLILLILINLLQNLKTVRLEELPISLTQNAIANWRRLTASMFDPGVNSCCETTVCGLSSSQHQNQLNLEKKAIYLA